MCEIISNVVGVSCSMCACILRRLQTSLFLQYYLKIVFDMVAAIVVGEGVSNSNACVVLLFLMN